MKGNRTYYEWIVETLDDEEGFDVNDPDIVDVSGYDTYPEARQHADQHNGTNIRIALRRDIINKDDGLMDRQYAYLSDRVRGTLPEQFEEGDDVPLKFRSKTYN